MNHENRTDREALKRLTDAIRLGAEAVDALTPAQAAAIERLGVTLADLQLDSMLLALDVALNYEARRQSPPKG